jgi:hypothetical protein
VIQIVILDMIRTNDDLFDRLETVHFFRLFTGEGDMENTGQGNIAQISLKRGAGEHVLHCDGSLKGLVITRV